MKLDQFIKKPVSYEERFREAKNRGYTDSQAKKYVESTKSNGLNILNNIHSLTKIHTDTRSKNKMSTKQMKDAAYNGSWKCHGYTLEPDATCPKCGNGVF